MPTDRLVLLVVPLKQGIDCDIHELESIKIGWFHVFGQSQQVEELVWAERIEVNCFSFFIEDGYVRMYFFEHIEQTIFISNQQKFQQPS